MPLETEFKFSCAALNDAHAIDVIRQVLSNHVTIKLLEPVGLEDLYLDTPERDLLHAGSTLRLRTRVGKKKWVVNFKPPRRESGDWMVRQEFRTPCKQQEAISVLNGGRLIGEAFIESSRFIENLQGVKADRRLEVVVSLHSFRRTYTVCSRYPVDEGPLPNSAATTGNAPEYRMFIGISFEDVFAYNISGAEPEDLLSRRFLDVYSNQEMVRFCSAEVEGWGEHDDAEEETFLLLKDIAQALKSKVGESFQTETKYSVSMRLLADKKNRDRRKDA